ncbi:hypothetical protein LCGC14_0393910 [marine sediment metagenome]|uniref:Uncharacterized protein n=1 Tax=marine sediment metagenome TaxID=412755 RepID=A0A0F9VKL8_9ZZZZ
MTDRNREDFYKCPHCGQFEAGEFHYKYCWLTDEPIITTQYCPVLKRRAKRQVEFAL